MDRLAGGLGEVKRSRFITLPFKVALKVFLLVAYMQTWAAEQIPTTVTGVEKVEIEQTQKANEPSNKDKPDFRQPYPYPIEHLVQTILQLIDLPDERFNKEDIEQITGGKFRFDTRKYALYRTEGYYMRAGDDWYWWVVFYTVENITYLSLTPDDLSPQRRVIFSGPSITANQLIAPLKEQGWELLHDRAHPYGVPSTLYYEKGKKTMVIEYRVYDKPIKSINIVLKK